MRRHLGDIDSDLGARFLQRPERALVEPAQPQQAISETDMDRLGDALTERSVEIFLDAGLLILISDRFIILSST